MSRHNCFHRWFWLLGYLASAARARAQCKFHARTEATPLLMQKTIYGPFDGVGFAQQALPHGQKSQVEFMSGITLVSGE